MNKKVKEIIWLCALPAVALPIWYIHKNATVSRQLWQATGEYNIGAAPNAKFSLDYSFKPAMRLLSEGLPDLIEKDTLPDQLDMQYSDGFQIQITYLRKHEEFRYGYIDQAPSYIAHGVTPKDIITAGKSGISFKNFKKMISKKSSAKTDH